MLKILLNRFESILLLLISIRKLQEKLYRKNLTRKDLKRLIMILKQHFCRELNRF